MSARSFDMTRKTAPPSRKAVVTSTQKAKPKKSEPKPKSPRPKKSLRERRERTRNQISGVIFILVALLCGAVVYGFWRPEVRVSEVRAQEVPDADMATARIREVLTGTYLGIFPRDSIFFYPEKEVQKAVLDAFPSLTSVTTRRDSFTALSIEGERRQVVFHWCGESGAEFSLTEDSCYEADEAGYIFAKVGDVAETASSTMLRIYAPLEGGQQDSPIRRTVIGTGYLPNLLEFVRAVKGFGLPVLSTFIQDDEAELYVTPKTRIKYVLGKEAEAIRNAEAGFKDLNLLNDSIEYVDLRFDGKLYVKRYE
jgi:hypothetical protein